MIHASVLERSILATLAYYDSFDWPLSAFEIRERLICPLRGRKPGAGTQKLGVSFYEIVTLLDKSIYLKERIEQENGFFFLKGRSGLAEKRVAAMKVSEQKLRKLWRYRWVFYSVPFLEGAFVSGSCACGWADEKSDIDVLVVATKGRIWTVRLFLTLWTTFLGIRRKRGEVADKVCLNHFVSNERLEVPFPSLYNAQTYRCLIPLVSRNKSFELFLSRNAWMNRYFLHPLPERRAQDYVYPFSRFRLLEASMQGERIVEEFLFSSFLGDLLEYGAKRLQRFLIFQNPLTGAPGGRIRAEDWQLEFHPESKELQTLTRYNKTLKELGLEEFYPEEDSGLTR